uniref:DUF4625 domain-containing protein n=1 Tax=uncultured Dysgonomonas sp. TaxID=206096 RepID=UPI0026296F03|nr:DUF4625 domain-containing protein [uncultured Dysgonomonas sp.]
MIRNILFILIVSLFTGSSIFCSCTKLEDNDHTPPTIDVFLPTANDTLYVYRETDTIFPIFKARFTDDTALSSYTFRIRHGKDSIRLAPGDTTAYFFRNYQSVSIFDSTEVTISQIFIVDSLMAVTVDGSSKTYPIWEGLYQLDASVVDMQGNVARFDPIPVFIKFRSSKLK